MNKKKAIGYFLAGLIFLVGVFVFKCQQKPKVEYIHNEGKTQGTYYSIIYLQPEGKDLQKEIDKRLHEFDLSLSTYDSTSIISRINRNDSTITQL